VIVSTFARGVKGNGRSCCNAEQRNQNNRRSRPRHLLRSYHFVIAVWRTKEADTAMTEKRFTALAADKLTAFLELEHQVLTQAETSIGPAGNEISYWNC